MPNPWLIVVVLVAMIGVFFGGYFKGKKDEHAAVVAAELVAQTKETAKVVEQSGVTEAVSEKAEAAAVEIRTVTQTIIKEVPVYVTKKADAKCVVPRGFVRLLNDSTTGVRTLPEPSGQPDDAASVYDLAAVGSNAAANLGACREAESNLTELQEWIRKQRALP